MALQLSPQSVRTRYSSLCQQIRSQFPSPDGHCVVRATGVKTRPFAPTYEDADLYLGSHVDRDPGSEDRVNVMSYHKEPQGGETILDECFSERQERPHWYRSKSQIVHAYARQYHSPGGTLLDAALLSIDLHSGEVLRNQQGAEALDSIQSLGLDRR